ncbi:hypothetical protein KK062_28980 [Fulvivirgaceae bacterium PWU5]|uniref:Uncharacterized protein n=1 Tax=Dawidia cretensis TaxID=2782350 RepID=A0AAP2E5K8_9BACT|nr:hypothetical protein [Dawidia cretensis]MBT1712312.1 hypothetical protein [Dawidia cretensis]
MARKDEIFKNFMEHESLTEKYGIPQAELPTSLAAGLNSEIPVIKSIALIVQSLESTTAMNDTSLRGVVTSYLNSAI